VSEPFGRVAANTVQRLQHVVKGKTDRTSRVPKFTFSDSLEEQEAQLARNPLIQRFRASRKRLAADRYRPLYHYVTTRRTC